MKTFVRSVVVHDDYGNRKEIQVQMPNGDLKRRFLVSLLRAGAVVPSEAVNELLLEVLRELERVYRSDAELRDELRATDLDLADANSEIEALVKFLESSDIAPEEYGNLFNLLHE